MSSPSIQRVHVPLPLMVTRKPEVFALSSNAYCFLPLSVVSAATIQYEHRIRKIRKKGKTIHRTIKILQRRRKLWKHSQMIVGTMQLLQ